MNKLNLIPDGEIFGVDMSLDGDDTVTVQTLDGRIKNIITTRKNSVRCTAFNANEIYYTIVNVGGDKVINVMMVNDYHRIKEFMTPEDKKNFWIQLKEEFICIDSYETLQELKEMGT